MLTCGMRVATRPRKDQPAVDDGARLSVPSGTMDE